MTEQTLAQAWLERRDPDAFRGLCDKHSGMVYATALRVLRDPTDAEDVTQECFLRLARASTSIRGSLGAWLHRVAVNLAIDHVRRTTARSAREETYAGLFPSTTEVTWNDLREHVDAAINELPDPIRDTVIAHYIQGVPQHVIAEAEGVTRSAISQRINRALQMVRATLEKRGVTVSLAALTAMVSANLAEAVAVPAGLAASLGNLAVYAGATQAGAGIGVGLLSLKGIAAILAALLAVSGIAFAVLHTQDARTIETAGVQNETPATTAAVPGPTAALEMERVGRDDTPALVPEPTPAAVPGAAVEGFVREQETGRPLMGVEVICNPDDGTGVFHGNDDASVHTDEEGQYRITGLVPGRYKLLCTSTWTTQDHGDPQKYKVQLRFAKNESIRHFDVADGNTHTLPDFKAIVGETISGIVVDSAGNSVADAAISVRGGMTFGNTNSFANGSFKVGGFPESDEVMLIATKGETNYSFTRTEPGGTIRENSPDRNALTSGVIGPLTVTKGGLQSVRLEVQPGASASGILFNHDGKLLARVNIMARSTVAGYFGSRITKTDDRGQFILSGLAEGTYDLAWNPPKPDLDEAQYGWTPHEAFMLKRIEVTWDQHLDGIQLRADALPGAGEGVWTLAGRVRDANGAPVEAAKMRAWESSKYAEGMETQTAQDGSYKLEGLPIGNGYQLRADHPDYSVYDQFLPEPVEVPMDIVLEDHGIVSGQVRYADTGMPVTSFYVRMMRGGSEPIFVEDDEGRFRVEDADAGENDIRLSAEGYRETGTLITVLPGREVAGIEVRLKPASSLTGIVVDERGTPVEGAFLFDKRVPSVAAERETQSLTKSGADGKFRIETLEKDSGSIAAWHAESGMGAVFYDTVSSDIEIVLRNNTGVVSGSVLVDGLAAAGAQVSLMGTDLLSAEAAAFGAPNRRINEDGAFRFEGVPEGEYNVSASIGIGEQDQNSYLGRNLARAITVERGADTEVLLEFPPEDASVEGRILFQGEPVSQGVVLLTLESPEGKQTHVAQVGEDGSYVVAPLAAGHATLRTSVIAQAPFSSVSQTLEFDVAPGEAVYRDIRYDGIGVVRGTVSGAPVDQQLPIVLLPGTVEFGAVTLETVLTVSQESVANTMVAGPGQFEISAVPPGDYTVFAWLSNSSGRVEIYGTAYATIREDEAPASVRLQLRAP